MFKGAQIIKVPRNLLRHRSGPFGSTLWCVKVLFSHPTPILAEALECLVERRGGLETVRQDAAGSEPVILVAMDSGLTPERLEELRRMRRSGSATLVLAEGPTVSTEVAASADSVMSLASTSQDLIARLLALGARRRTLSVSDQAAGYFEVRLSANEQRAAQFLSRGASNQEIAAAMGCSEQSVKNYMRQLMRKLGCKNRVQLLLKLSKAD